MPSPVEASRAPATGLGCFSLRVLRNNVVYSRLRWIAPENGGNALTELTLHSTTSYDTLFMMSHSDRQKGGYAMNAVCLSRYCLTLLLALSACVPIRAEDTEDTRESTPHITIVVDLIDGSSLKGVPSIDAIGLETAYAKLNISLSEIYRITISDDHETAAITLANGDLLTGVFDTSIEMKTLFGVFSVNPANISEVLILKGNHGGALTRGLVLHYAFDHDKEVIEDSSESENNGTLHNAKLVDNERYGRVLSLDGENDRVRIPNKPSLEIVKELTLAYCINITTFGPGGYANERAFVINKGRDFWWNPTYALGFNKGSGSGRSRWPGRPGPFPALFHVCKATGAQNGGGKTLSSKTKLKTGEWYHVAGTYNGEELKIYINGKLENTAEYTGSLRSDKAPVFLGGGNLSSIEWGNHFTANCLLDKVRIYNRALSSSEIAHLANAR